ncbi:MAG TPA: LptF/LptG family permease, partial [Gemmatimonadales bacterium]|nr:LptF/LptG family permease [Gemmatimonadales bacterium]
PGQFFLRAGRIDPAHNALSDVTIYDLQDPDRRRIIMADSGRMAYSPSGTDLYLTLRDGEVHEIKRTDPEHFNRTFYGVNRIKVAGVSNSFETTKNDEYRGDREMTICQMQDVVARADQDRKRVRAEALAAVRSELRRIAKLTPLPLLTPDTTPPRPSVYCRVLGAIRKVFGATPAEAATLAQATPSRRPPPSSITDLSYSVQTPSAYAQRRRAAEQRAAVYAVEIHKKFAISAACIIFALLGVPLAIRYPRGGVGLVIGTSLAVFSIYYVGLIGGEELGDRLIVPPFFAMWTPNLIFLLVSIPLLIGARRAGNTAHGGDWEEIKQIWFGWVSKVWSRL